MDLPGDELLRLVRRDEDRLWWWLFERVRDLDHARCIRPDEVRDAFDEASQLQRDLVANFVAHALGDQGHQQVVHDRIGPPFRANPHVAALGLNCHGANQKRERCALELEAICDATRQPRDIHACAPIVTRHVRVATLGVLPSNALETHSYAGDEKLAEGLSVCGRCLASRHLPRRRGAITGGCSSRCSASGAFHLCHRVLLCRHHRACCRRGVRYCFADVAPTSTL
mmetsp:Transcript_13209/g.55317  ORF Transcript_13209/g.55317 Transcript_13209/m.55317 type:complete len:227 (-) Transcript_13209:1558-2238(-)